MAMMRAIAPSDLSVRERVSQAEWETRVALAACYRLVNLHGWSHLVYNHISARLPDAPDHYLINPFGLHYREITASSLIKVDEDGRLVDEADIARGVEGNPAGFVIHGAIHKARPDLACVAHTHTEAGMAVSALRGGLRGFCQDAMIFHGRLGYHAYEGIALDLDEQKRLVADLGPDGIALILRNHGLLTVGRTVAEAFVRLWHLEKLCRTQMLLMAAGAEMVEIAPEVQERTAAQYRKFFGDEPEGTMEWPALLRMLDAEDPGYAV